MKIFSKVRSLYNEGYDDSSFITQFDIVRLPYKNILCYYVKGNSLLEGTIFCHECRSNAIGQIINKRNNAYCNFCYKDLKVPYKHVVFVVKLINFKK